ncbi:DNA internalization-related competence protein ComEC/Rec2 [Microbulbifer magnicolonia]|uniref:DNA internalization-related competence protein ComEC/Rec2 n=1 Tax=Microbulbifer magnicolonia TaxID=3109744 RepID=UPI002B416822|nr:DNA internalization-related competence protein ComEC/Rec2 [Microbulbifer sp. GG15]
MESTAASRTAHLSPSAMLWAYAAGVMAIGSLPSLPAGILPALVAVALLAATRLLPARTRRPIQLLLLAALAGGSWALWHNHEALDNRLPLSHHGTDFLLEVQIESLPEMRRSEFGFDEAAANTSLRFTARVLGAPQPLAPGLELRGQRLDLTWYRIDDRLQGQLRAGSRWMLPVRLKRPRGSVNPHGFDYEGWLLQRGIYATGYVRPQDREPQWLASGTGLAALRHELRDRLLALAPERGPVLSALLLGDRGGISADERRLLRETGTAHLLAISGLHVGLVAGFFLFLGSVFGRVIGLYTGATPGALAVIFALAAALVYTLLAGAPLSARRALVMTWIMLLAWQWRRRISAGFAFSLSLALVLTLQPLAFFGAGFWLSFVAVGALLLGFTGRARALSRKGESGPGAALALLDHCRGLLRAQWLVAIALFLPSLLFFSGFSPAGLLLNLVAIPWLGILVLPALLLGTLMVGTLPGSWFIGFSAWQLDLLIGFLAAGRDALPAWQTLGPPLGWVSLLVATVAIGLLLLPAGLPGRRLGWLFLLPPLLPFLPQADSGEASLRVAVLDVGQGLAVVVRTPQQRLLYDTGPLSASGWSAGSQIIAPYLLGEGMPALDAVVVSHGDRDHAGGFAGLAESLPLGHLVAPGRLAQRLRDQSGRDAGHCLAGEEEALGDLRLRWVWPETEDISGEENDHSCVVLVQWRGVRILLAGDISSGVERQLSQKLPDFAPVDLLIAPHHGSRTSSSRALLDWAKPRHVVFSAGYRHHFGHPHPDVVGRYEASGAELFNTAESGALEFTWQQDGRSPQVKRARSAPRFWYADHTDETDAGWRLSHRGQLW